MVVLPSISPSWSQMVFKALLIPQEIFSKFSSLHFLLNSSGEMHLLKDLDGFRSSQYYFCQVQ